MASFHEKINEENIDHEEKFKEYHWAIFDKMLKESMELAVNLLSTEKEKEIDDKTIKNLVEEIMKEKINLLAKHLN